MTKGFATLPLTAIRTFCGFPMGLVTLPIVMPNAKVSSMSFAGNLHCFARRRTTGVPMIARVSFIRKAELAPVTSKTVNNN